MKKQIFKVSLATSMLLVGVNSSAITTTPIELYTPQTQNYSISEDMTISSSNGSALSLLGDGTLSSPITVSNTKNVSIDGLSDSGEALQIFNANLTNSGTITATGSMIHAISLNDPNFQIPIYPYNQVSITPGSYSIGNTGTITVVDNYGVALYIAGGIDVSTSVTNGQTGIIQSVKADGTVGNYNTAIAGYNLTIQNEGVIKGVVSSSYASSITNSGTISGLVRAQGQGAETDILEITNTGIMTGGVWTYGDSLLVNNENIITGDISVSNNPSISNVDNRYTYVYNQNSLNLTNNGTLTGDVSAFGSNAQIINNDTIIGNISASNSSDNYSYTYDSSTYQSSDYSYTANHDGVLSLENNGTISGNINAQESFSINNTGNINGDIILSDSSSSTPSTLNNMENGSITGNIISLYNIAIDNDGLITAKITAPSSSFINHGSLVLSAPIDNSSGITPVISTLDTFENHGTLNFSLNTEETNTTYSKLEARVITLKSGSQIGINVNGNSSDVKLLIGETLSGIVKATETLTIEDETIKITDASPLIKFKLIENGNQIDTLILKEATYNDVTVSGQGNTTAQKAAKVLDLISDNSANYPTMNSTFEKLNDENVFDSAEKIAKAVESTTPQYATSSSVVASQISSNISAVAMQRQNPNFGSVTGKNSGDEVVQDKNLWIKPFGSIGSQSNKDGLNGFGVKSYGMGMGFDTKNKDDQLAGFGLFLTNANVDMNNVSQESDVKSYSMMMYGSVPVIDNKTNLLYQLGYGLQKTDSKRDIFTGDIATADYTSKIATIDTRLVRDYQIDNNLLIQPLAYATYRNFKTPAYIESGAGALNLQVEQSSSSEMIVGLGTIATYKLNPTDKLIGSLSAGYDLKDDKNIVNSSYSGASGLSFETVGIDNGKWLYDAGIGYEKAMNSNNSINVNYNLQGKGTDYTNNVISANYIYKF